MGMWQSKYKEEYCQQLLDYFNGPLYEDFTITAKNGKSYTTRRVANPLPYFGKFALEIGVTMMTLNRWLEKHGEFIETYEMCKELQKYFVVVNALLGLYNPAFAIFTLKNISGWRDKQEIEHTGKLDIDTLMNTVSKNNKKKSMVDKD